MVSMEFINPLKWAEWGKITVTADAQVLVIEVPMR